VKAFPFAPALLNMSLANGGEPSEQTSIKLVTNKVSIRPFIVGPNSVTNSSVFKNSLSKLAIKTPKRSHLRMILDSITPIFRALIKLNSSLAVSPVISPKAKGLLGRIFNLMSKSNKIPVIIAINVEKNMNNKVHLMPIKVNNIRVKEKLFQGEAIKKAIT